jgi:hypothetical protein
MFPMPDVPTPEWSKGLIVKESGLSAKEIEKAPKASGVYISGPMRGYPNDNHEAFFIAEKYLINLKITLPIVNPAFISERDGYSNLEFPDIIIRDIADVIQNNLGLVLLEGWEESEGCSFEIAAAKFMKTPIITMADIVAEEEEAGQGLAFFNRAFRIAA